MRLQAHICANILTNFFVGAVSCAISRVSQRWAQFWKALLLGYKTHPLVLNEACVKKDLRTIEVCSIANQFSLTSNSLRSNVALRT